MKRGATKEEIIRTTQDLITRNGIRAVRVDEIAQRLGISKRTLYEMFADKNDLISACLDDLARRQPQTTQRQSAAKDAPARQRLYRQPLYGRSQFSGGHTSQGPLRRTIRRTPRVLAQGVVAQSRGVSRGGVAPVGDRHRRSGRATDEHAVRAAAEPHDARRALPPLPDDSPGRCDAAGNRPHRPETVIRIPADRKSRRRILRLFLCPEAKKSGRRNDLFRNFFIFAPQSEEKSETMTTHTAYGEGHGGFRRHMMYGMMHMRSDFRRV